MPDLTGSVGGRNAGRAEVTYTGVKEHLGALVIDGLLRCAVFLPVTRLVKGVWIMSATDHPCPRRFGSRRDRRHGVPRLTKGPSTGYNVLRPS